MNQRAHYCLRCGAVNASADEICHACHASLSAVSAPETLLNGRYRLLTQVGSGDDGAVDSAIDTQQNKLVAVKQISLQGLSDTERIEATDAQRRPASIREVQNELQRLAAHCARREPLSQTEAPFSRTPPPIPQGGPGAQIPRRRVLQSLGVGTLVLAGVATVGGWAGLTSCTSAPQYHGVVPVGVTPIATPGADYIYRGHRAGVTTVAWSRDGRYFASGSVDKTVQVWQATNGALRYTFVGHTSPVTALAWDVTSTYITSAGDEDGKVWVWNALRDEQKAGHMGQHGRVLSLAWPDPYDTTRTSPVNVILSGAEDGTVQVWDAESGKATTNYAGQGAVRALLSYSPDRVLLAGNDHIIHHWEIFAGGNTSLTPATYEGHTGAINALAWIDENNTFASASDDGTVRVWSATSTQSSASPKLTYRGHTGSVYAVVAYKGLIISGGQDHVVQIWRFDTGKLLYTYTGHQGPIRSLSVVPPLNNATHMHTPVSFVASASDDGTVHVWHIPEKVLAAGRFP